MFIFLCFLLNTHSLIVDVTIQQEENRGFALVEQAEQSN